MIKQHLLKLAQLIAQILHTKQHSLRNIQWTDSEANTDIGFSKLACMCAVQAWAKMQELYPEYSGWQLIAEPPDVNLIIVKIGMPNKTGKIELKSGTTPHIPGSTIAKLDINEPAIFCLRPKTKDGEYKFRYAQYHSSMGSCETETFQDRTPRPQVNFAKMSEITDDIVYIEKDKGDWAQHYAKCAINRIEAGSKYKSWQDDLTKLIINEYLKRHTIDEIIAIKVSLN